MSYPALLGQPFPLLAYPIEAVLAEKLVTMVARGDTTTRGRDFADVLLLAGHHDIDAVSLSRAVAATAGFRQVALLAISKTLVTLGRDRQRDWQRLLARAGLEGKLPSDYSQAIRASHGLRRSSRHRLADVRPLGPSARPVDGLASPALV